MHRLKDYGLLNHLHFPEIVINRQPPRSRLQLAQDTLGDLLQVRLKTSWWWTLGLTQTLAYLRGLTQFLMDFIDQPAGLHQVMAFLRDGTLARLDFLEQHSLLILEQ